MESRIILFVMFGFALVLSVALERALSRRYLSLPIVYVLLGYLLFSLPLDLPHIHPVWDGLDAVSVEYVTEFIVIVSLMGAGIAIDRPVSWANWRQIWPLLVIAMPLTITAVALLGWWGLGMAPATAILLGASLAPTDPVLARSVQVGPPGENERHDVRFSLTVEAGLNDGLAFPFTYLAIAAIGMTGVGMWTLEWFAVDFVWRILAGCVVGWAVGRAGAWYVFEREADAPIEEIDEDSETKKPVYSTSEGLIVLGTLLSAYGLAELAEGYGFLAVFVGAVTARQRENKSRYHKISHHFIDQIEKIVLVGVLLGFGAMLASGVLNSLTWAGAGVALALIFVIRPLAGLLSEAFCDLPLPGRLAVAFLGIRGMGSIYYLAYGQNHGEFSNLNQAWAVASFAILVSILIHGISAARLMLFVEDSKSHVHVGRNPHVEDWHAEADAAAEVKPGK